MIEPLLTPPDIPLLREALGGFATGVTIVTCRTGSGEPVGLTVSSFNALSLEPPMVLWSLRLVSPNLAAFDTASHFAVNVLAEAQVDLSRRFSSNAPDKFVEGAWVQGVGGAPVLAGCVAAFECEAASHQTAGDHRLYLGRVLAVRSQAVTPLVHQGGRYHLLGEIL